MPGDNRQQREVAKTSSGEWRETESRSPRFEGLETWPLPEVLRALLGGQHQALHAVEHALPDIEKAASAAIARLSGAAGRLVYVGAGTSGRLAILDAVELPPTFGWPRERIVYAFAGGKDGFIHDRERAEDDAGEARATIADAGLGPQDVVLALAASGTTPYTRAAVAEARRRGALTISFANNPGSPLLEEAEIGILLRTGAEVLSGSTRLAAGTSQKVALNLFSTTLMIGLNRVYGGCMVDMEVSNEKLVARAERMLISLTGCSEDAARKALAETSGNTKIAVLVVGGMTAPAARDLLERHGGNLHAALGETKL